MSYDEALAWLYATQTFGIKLGLENIRRLLGDLGWHGREQRFFHVAGTNGKGSVCAMLDAVCRAAGFRTGLFTSPHLVTFRERIRIGSEMIAEEKVADGLARIRGIVNGWETHPTFFEITTALALLHFQNERVEIVALETGMGGRFDATNVVTPAVSVITAIDLDHQAWLGCTLREIAGEKAGIIKPGIPVVTVAQQPEAADVLRKTARRQKSALSVIHEGLETPLGLAGSHQARNAAVAVEALRASGLELSGEALRRGLKDVAWPGRFQIFDPGTVLDGAHNPAAAVRLAHTWREVFGNDPATLILGILADKDAAEIARPLLPLASSVITTPVRNPRTSDPAWLKEIIREINPAMPCSAASDLSEALAAARARPDRRLIAGSLFLVGEALALLERRPFGESRSLQ